MMYLVDIDLYLGCALFGGMLAFLAAGYGGALMSLCSQILARRSKQVFLDKFGQQMTRMALWSLLVSFLLAGGCLVLASYRFGFAVEGLLAADPNLMAWPPGLLVLAAVLLWLSLVSWRPLKRRHSAHLLFGLLATAALFLFIPVAVNVAGHQFRGSTEEAGAAMMWWSALWPISGQHLGPLVGQLFCLGPGCGGAWALMYLLKRRNRDDFGRDYYRHMSPLGARWALAFTLQVPFAAWMARDILKTPWQELMHQDMSWAFGVFLVLAALAAILWSKVLKSTHPMREKAAMIGSALCVWIAVSANVLGYVRLFGLVQSW